MEVGKEGLPEGVRYWFSQELPSSDVPIRLGFVSKNLAYGHWYSQMHCKCEWSVGSSCCEEELRTDFVKLEELDWLRLIKEKPVDAVVFVGCRPERQHPLWNCKIIKMIIWIVEIDSNRRRGMTSPKTWEVESHEIVHSELGGVTNGRFRIFCAQPKRTNRVLQWKWHYNHFQNNLAQIQSTVESGAPAKITTVLSKGTLNTPFGLLDWKGRTGGVVYAKSVFLDKQGKWVRRRLTTKEQLNALDIPASVSCNIADVEGREIAQVPVPGKVVSLAVGLIQLRNQGPSESVEEWEEEIVKEGVKLSDDPIGVKAECSPRSLQVLSSYDLLVGQVADSISAKATKADESPVPDYIWNKFLIDGAPKFLGNALHQEKGKDLLVRPAKSAFLKIVFWMRQRMLPHWKRKLIREMIQWYKVYGTGLPENKIVRKRMREVSYHVGWCSWWNWDRGSTLFFWRWPLLYMSEALYGVPPRFDSTPPQYWTPQPPYTNETTRQLVKDKLKRVLERGYVQRTHAHALKGLMFMFDVPKGDSDIRMVYDGTKSGLNQALWSPWFRLPTAEALFEVVTTDYWCTDNDYGDFFLNFPMHHDLKSYCGVDLTQLFTREEIEALDVFESFLDEELTKDKKDEVKCTLILAVWERMAMGLRPSPYVCVQYAGRSNRLILGNRNDPSNPFAWSEVKLNLPGTEHYDSSMPWIYKVRDSGEIATDLVRFVDDLRNTGATEQLAWEASTRIGKISSWFGQQDAPRKRRTPSKNPGAWAATVISTEDKLEKYITQEAWEKAQKRIRYLAYYAGCEIDKADVDFSIERELKIRPRRVGNLIHKVAEKYVGYLVHISATYDAIFPYLRGLYMTMNRWRPGRDEDGWRDLMWFRLFKERKKPQYEKPPKYVKCYPRVKEDMRILLDFFSAKHPPKIPIRPSGYATFYIIGDASGTGFGSTAWDDKSKKVKVQFGGWDEAFQENSSNLREAYNTILGLEGQIKSGKIKKGTEIFIFTDNSTTESVFSHGSSKSKLLHELAIRMRRLQMDGQIFIHVIWIAGKRMIAQGTDSVSRGDLCSGVMAGDPFLHHIPLSQDASSRAPDLVEWLKGSLPGNDWKFLIPQEWYTIPFEDPIGRYVWFPPPAIAHKAVELLCEAHHIHPYSSHVFICPTLMTLRWRKTLMKCSDLVVTIPAGYPLGAWAGPSGWLKGKLKCAECSLPIPAQQGIVCDNFGMRRSGFGDRCQHAWHAKCYKQAKEDGFPVLGVQDLEDSIIDDNELVEDEDPFRFKEARNGDHLMCPFQCDICQFRNLRGRDPIDMRQEDLLTLVCIRRANLDAFWSRERSTVEHNCREMKKYLAACLSLGEEHPIQPKGPWPENDGFGLKPALALLIRSLDAGINAAKVQFGTVRKMRSCFSNYAHASAGGMGDSFVGDEGNTASISRAASNSSWFRRFIKGMHKRMGDVWIPDRAITIHEVKAAFEILENDWKAATAAGDKDGLKTSSLTAAAIIGSFFAALRGEEVTKIDLGGIRKHWNEAIGLPVGSKHVPLMLAGRFKRETGEKIFCQPLAVTTKSGINIATWFMRVIWILEKLGETSGPLFKIYKKGTKKYSRASVGDVDRLFLNLWKRVQVRHPNLIPKEVDVDEEYSISRSGRRGATSHAQNMGVPQPVIEANNRWRKHQRSRGLLPGMSMMERYSDAKASVPTLIRFSASM